MANQVFRLQLSPNSRENMSQLSTIIILEMIYIEDNLTSIDQSSTHLDISEGLSAGDPFDVPDFNMCPTHQKTYTFQLHLSLKPANMANQHNGSIIEGFAKFFNKQVSNKFNKPKYIYNYLYLLCYSKNWLNPFYTLLCLQMDSMSPRGEGPVKNRMEILFDSVETNESLTMFVYIYIYIYLLV